MRRFREGEVKILVATDGGGAGARCWKTSAMFINYDMPNAPPMCNVHRIGRTGRAGKKGTASPLIESSMTCYANP